GAVLDHVVGLAAAKGELKRRARRPARRHLRTRATPAPDPSDRTPMTPVQEAYGREFQFCWRQLPGTYKQAVQNFVLVQPRLGLDRPMSRVEFGRAITKEPQRNEPLARRQANIARSCWPLGACERLPNSSCVTRGSPADSWRGKSRRRQRNALQALISWRVTE